MLWIVHEADDDTHDIVSSVGSLAILVSIDHPRYVTSSINSFFLQHRYLITVSLFRMRSRIWSVYDCDFDHTLQVHWTWFRRWDLIRVIFTISRYLPFVGSGMTAYGESPTLMISSLRIIDSYLSCTACQRSSKHADKTVSNDKLIVHPAQSAPLVWQKIVSHLPR